MHHNWVLQTPRRSKRRAKGVHWEKPTEMENEWGTSIFMVDFPCTVGYMDIWKDISIQLFLNENLCKVCFCRLTWQATFRFGNQMHPSWQLVASDSKPGLLTVKGTNETPEWNSKKETIMSDTLQKKRKTYPEKANTEHDKKSGGFHIYFNWQVWKLHKTPSIPSHFLASRPVPQARSPEHRSGSTTLQSTSVLTASKVTGAVVQCFQASNGIYSATNNAF